MLNKEICRKCFSDYYLEGNCNHTESEHFVFSLSFFEQKWNDGDCHCYIVVEDPKITDEPPSDCDYILEHLLKSV